MDNKSVQQLDLNLLKVFESLYQQRNMTRTAELLHVTPSAVSHAVKRLRECLGDPLFERSEKGMIPTPACQRLAPLMLDNLSRLRQILQQWGTFEPASSQHHFTIGMHDALEVSVLPKLVSAAAEKAPLITLSSVKIERSNLQKELLSGHLDVALDIGMAVKPPVHHKQLITDDFCVLMRRNHPLEARLTPESYLDTHHLTVSNRPGGAAVEERYFLQLGEVRHVRMRCQNYYAAQQIVRDTDVLLTLPRAIATQLLMDDLVMVNVPFEMPSLSTHLYWHDNMQTDAASQWLRALICEALL